MNSVWSVVLCLVLAAAPSALHAGDHEGHQAIGTMHKAGTEQGGRHEVFTAMPEPGDKVPLGSGHYLIYGFVKRPKMGTVIFKVQVFDEKGEKDRSFRITADSWMPSMPSMQGGHGTCMVNKKGDYLVPIDITMPGDWEVKLTVAKDDKVVYRGAYRFDV